MVIATVITAIRAVRPAMVVLAVVAIGTGAALCLGRRDHAHAERGKGKTCGE
jgi:1,4-dihydroxy-2-naphthoate octaprenyltransferase